MAQRQKISLVLADVDGTLVNEQKILTERAQKAVSALHAAGIRFAITSGRPPRGMSMLIEPLALRGAIAGFNGGVFVNPDLTVIESHTLDPTIAQQTLRLILDQGLDAWVYTEDEWLIRDKEAPHVARETSTVKFDAKGRSVLYGREPGAGGKDRRHLRQPRPGRWLPPGRWQIEADLPSSRSGCALRGAKPRRFDGRRRKSA